MGQNESKWDEMGPNGTTWDKLGPHGTTWDHVGPHWTTLDHMGRNGTEWEKMGPINQNHLPDNTETIGSITETKFTPFLDKPFRYIDTWSFLRIGQFWRKLKYIFGIGVFLIIFFFGPIRPEIV